MFIISISVNGTKVFPFRLFPHRCSIPMTMVSFAMNATTERMKETKRGTGKKQEEEREGECMTVKQ